MILPKTEEQQALKLYIKLARATNEVTAFVHRHLQQANLTHSQFAVLEALHHLGPMSQGQLGEKILKSNANLTTVVDSLEKKSLVKRRRPEADRRKVVVHLTTSGRHLIERIFPTHVAAVSQRVSVLTRQERQQLELLLEKLGKG